MLVKNCLLFVFYYLLQFIKSVKIYQCARYINIPGQCLNQWVDIYGNVKVDLWKCKKNMYCHLIPKKYDEDNYIGVCTYNYKKLYDGDKCSMNSECSSMNCTYNKCVGFSIGEFCNPDNFQCANNLVCRSSKEILPYGEFTKVYKCNNLSQVNETCENNHECDLKLICGNSYIYNLLDLIKSYNIIDIAQLKNVINFEKYNLTKQNTSKICIERALLDNGFPTSDPMICKSGDAIDIEIYPNYNESICVSKKEIIKDCGENNTCIIKADLGNFNNIEILQDCIVSVRGNPFCPLEQKEVAWNNYLSTYQKFYISENVEEKRNLEFHFPVYKDTLNIFNVSQSYWHYKEWQYMYEADSCTKEYFFLKNKAGKLNYYFYYLTFIYFFL